jgi:NAD(P)-dependent dehydrogenase (short-subunit alcohol dehydrogenase family)
MPDRAAIVTGASRGIGRALADALGSEGYGLTISARRPEPLEQAARELRGQGIGIGANAGEAQAKLVDMQLAVNLRSIILAYRECLDLLRAAGAEHRNALVINMSSLAGKSAPAWLSVYGATKAGVIAYTRAMNKELNSDGIKSVAFCPGFVDTDMTDFVKGTIPPEEMLKTSDIVAALKFVLRVSPACVIPEIVFERPGEII